MSKLINKHGLPYDFEKITAENALKLADERKRQKSGNLVKSLEKFIQQWAIRSKQDIRKWRQALTMAESIENPVKAQLYNLYRDVVIDAHLSSLMQTRSLKILKSEMGLINEKGEVDQDKTELLRRPWFYDLLFQCSIQPFWGYTLIEFGDIMDGEIQNINVIPHALVKERFGIVVKEPADEKGIDYRSANVNQYLLEIGRPGDLGLLMKAAPQVLWKKNAQAAWSEFTEIFGMPLRVGKTSNQDDDRRRMAEALETMGRAAYAVINEGDEIDLVKSAGQQEGYKVYDNLIERTNSELAKLILGGTMVSDDGSSRSQSEVHERVSDDIVMADQQYISYLFNFQLLPKLINLGYPFQGLRFKWLEKQELSLADQWKMIYEAIQTNQFELDVDEIKERFNLPITGLKVSNSATDVSKNDTSTPLGDQGKKKEPTKLSLMAGDYELCGCSDQSLQLAAKPYSGLTSAYNKLIQAVWDGHQANYDFAHFYAEQLRKSLFKGYRSGVKHAFKLSDDVTWPDIDWDDEDKVYLRAMQENVWKFSAATTQNEILEMNGLLKKSQDFKQFKELAQSRFSIINAHLRTEYNQVELTAQAVSRHNRHTKLANNGTYLWWQYQTVGDGRVRAEHAALDGATFRFNDEIWNTIYPPNGWNCRCIVVPRRKPNPDHKLQTAEQALEALQEEGGLEKMKRFGFDRNPATNPELFREGTKNFQQFLPSLNWKGYGLQPSNILMKTANYNPKITAISDTNYAKEWFEKFAINPSLAVVEDWLKMPVKIKKKPFLRHAKSDYKLKDKSTEDRLKLLPFILEWLQYPDEVWMRKGEYQLIKYAKRKTYTIILTDQDGSLFLNSWHELKKELIDKDKRVGALIYKKVSNLTEEQ